MKMYIENRNSLKTRKKCSSTTLRATKGSLTTRKSF